MTKSQISATYEAVYNTLKQRILSLELVPGTMVSETEIAKEFLVSRTPVRDAFKALVSDGLLEVKPHIGTFVTLINMNELSNVLYIRETIERAIVNELAIAFNQSQEFKLRHILHHQKTLLEDTTLSAHDFAKAFTKSDNDFHHALFELAGKQSLIGYFKAINVQYERFFTFLNLQDQQIASHLYDEHIKLLECIKSKDIAVINNLITHHIYDGVNNKTSLIYEYPNYFNL